MASTEEVAAMFLDNVAEEYDDQDVEDIAAAIERNFGLEGFEILGSGAFGTASVPVGTRPGTAPAQRRFKGSSWARAKAPPLLPVGVDFVFKLTSDPEEVQAAANLIGKKFTNVARFYGAWWLSDFTVLHKMTLRDIQNVDGDPDDAYLRIGVVLNERLAATGIPAEGREVYPIKHLVVSAKDAHKTWPHQLIAISRTTARQRLKIAQARLIDDLEVLAESSGNQWAAQLANGLTELRSAGVYTVDAHMGNVGYTIPGEVLKIFDVGVSSSPGRKRPTVLANPSAVPVLMDPLDRWPWEALAPEGNPIETLE